jgi:hypothetical protein
MTEDLSDIGGPAHCFAFFIGNELANLGLVECLLLADPSRARQFSAGSHGLHCSHRQSKYWGRLRGFDAFGASCGILHDFPCATLAVLSATRLPPVNENRFRGELQIISLQVHVHSRCIDQNFVRRTSRPPPHALLANTRQWCRPRPGSF